jgi:AraC family transcriptional regulator
MCGSGMRIIRYLSGASEDRHAHDVGSVTLVLKGVVDEYADQTHARGTPLSIVVKPPGVPHANEYGLDGVVTFQIALSRKRWAGLGHWRWIHDTRASGALLRLLHGSWRGPGRDVARDELLEEALAALRPGPSGPLRTPPNWLLRVRDALDEESRTVAGLAAEAGVHPVHLAREFRRHFGRAPSEYRRTARIRRAARSLSEGRSSLAETTHMAGFSDQAHMNREIRSAIGLTPATYRALISSL